MWGWRGAAAAEAVRARLVEVLAARGYRDAGKGGEATHAFGIVADGQGSVVVRGDMEPALALACALSAALGVEARFAAVELQDFAVHASSQRIDAQGVADAGADHDDEAGELCEEWHEGAKYRTEAGEALVDLFLGYETDGPEGGAVLRVRAAASARVQELVNAVHAGSAWTQTTVGGRPVVKVTRDGATVIKALDAGEMAAFLALVPPRG